MKPAAFEYVAPRSLDEAVEALANGGADAKLLAGGQSLIPLLKLRIAAPSALVDSNGIEELHGLVQNDDTCASARLCATRSASARSY